MIISFHADADPRQIQAVRTKLESASSKLHLEQLTGTERVVLAAIGDASRVQELGLEGMPGVDHVIPIGSPYKLASRDVAKDNQHSVVNVGDVSIGANNFCLIAGPCTIENREQALADAAAVADAGASMLRGGVFKPRTSPFSFQGLGVAGLQILAEMRDQTGLPIVSELTEISYTEQVAEVVDVIQVGARNMQNYALLQAVGKTGRPVLLKRGLSSTLDELLMAADYILKEGNSEVILCERGIRTFENATRFTLDIAAVPYLKEHSHLPVIVDPSHAPGNRNLVPALSAAAAAAGADGIIVEVTKEPENALCDGPQQVYASKFPQLVEKVRAHAALEGKKIS